MYLESSDFVILDHITTPVVASCENGLNVLAWIQKIVGEELTRVLGGRLFS